MTKRSTKTSAKIIFASVFLYALPIVFFIISYFLLTTSGEDIWQGAGSFRTGLTISPIDDAINAFNYNSRITDMYAWPIIDFFDYQFSFGPDFFFRLFDVLLASGTFYLASFLILGRRPKLQIKDALVFCASFVFFIITPFGRPFYHEFSMVHNYVPVAFTLLLFSIPYLKLIRGESSSSKHPALLTIGMLILGLYFGMASTVTPLAFLVAIILYCIIKRKSLARPPIWFYTGILGLVTGFLICWFAGNGVNHYTNPDTAEAFDYVSIEAILNEPATAIPKIFWHIVYNFGIILIPILIITIICITFSTNRKQFFQKKFFTSLTSNTKRCLLLTLLFVIIHILGTSLIKAPARLAMPAFLVSNLFVLFFFLPYIRIKPASISIGIFTTTMLIIHSFLLAEYHITTSEILTEIEQCNCTEVCVDYSRTLPPRIPVLDLSQAGFLVDWGSPEVVYGKNVTFCK